MASSQNPQRPFRALQAFALATLGFMVLVILEGAIVRATSSGGGCGNHWPLCNGDFVPHHPRLATIIEFTHRSMTGVCTTLVAVLLFWIFRTQPKQHRVRRAAFWSGILLITEGALGAVLVKGGYVEGNASNARVFVQCIHFTNTMLLVAALTLTWWWLRNPTALVSFPARSRSLSCLAVFFTMITGATGSVAALADTLFPSPSLRAGLSQDFDPAAPLLIHMRWIHPAAAVLSVVCVLWIALKMRNAATHWLIALVAAQLVLGLADIILLAPITMQVLHLLGADLFWIALVAATAETLRPQPATTAASAETSGPLTVR